MKRSHTFSTQHFSELYSRVQSCELIVLWSQPGLPVHAHGSLTISLSNKKQIPHQVLIPLHSSLLFTYLIPACWKVPAWKISIYSFSFALIKAKWLKLITKCFTTIHPSENSTCLYSVSNVTFQNTVKYIWSRIHFLEN